jgi:hypothetical protein
MRYNRFLLACMLLSSIAACGVQHNSHRTEPDAAVAFRNTAAAAVRALPIDSLCGGNCRFVIVDTLVRRATARNRLDIIRLPVLGNLTAAEVARWQLTKLKIIPGKLRLRAADADTVRVGLVIADSENHITEKNVIATVILPRSLGLVVDMELHYGYDGTWRVSRMRIFEG